VRTAADSLTPAQTLSVLRLASNVLTESKVGMIYTHGDPAGTTRNQVAGVDFFYRNSSFRPGKRLWASAYLARSSSSSKGSDNSWGAGVAYPNQPWALEARVQQVGNQFAPALGFLNRPGIRTYTGVVERVYRRNNKILQRVNVQDFSEVTTGLDNRMQSAQDRLKVELRYRTNDELVFAVRRVAEVLKAPFALPGNVAIPGGHYQWYRGEVELSTTTARPISAGVSFYCCNYYLGTMAEYGFGISWHPNATYGLALSHQRQQIRQPSGHTTIHIDSAIVNVSFTPRMVLNSELQYDNVSRRFAASIRYKWQIRPETELFAALGESSLLTGALASSSYHSQGTAFIMRVGHRLQY
jgi:hypothetical protein